MDDPIDPMTLPISPPTEVAPDSPAVSDLDAVRELVLRAHPQVVPELVRGDSIAEMLASVTGAEAAYQRIAGRIAPVAPVAPTVPAGGHPPVVIDPDLLPATEKIRRGISARS